MEIKSGAVNGPTSSGGASRTPGSSTAVGNSSVTPNTNSNLGPSKPLNNNNSNINNKIKNKKSKDITGNTLAPNGAQIIAD